MPKIQIAYDEDLTKQKVRDIFTSHFSSTYEIDDLGSDFAIKKTNFTAMAIKYIQKPKKGQAFISYFPFIPSAAARFFLGGALLMVILMATSWPKLTNEVKNFILASPDIKAIVD